MGWPHTCPSDWVVCSVCVSRSPWRKTSAVALRRCGRWPFASAAQLSAVEPAAQIQVVLLSAHWVGETNPDTLWWTYKKLLNMAIEIVDFPMKNGDFPWQNVSSPEGKQLQENNMRSKIQPHHSVAEYCINLKSITWYISSKISHSTPWRHNVIQCPGQKWLGFTHVFHPFPPLLTDPRPETASVPRLHAVQAFRRRAVVDLTRALEASGTGVPQLSWGLGCGENRGAMG